MFEKLAPDSVKVDEVDCLGECGMGPNVQTVNNGKVFNGCKTMLDVATILEENCVDCEGLVAKSITQEE
eukprot:CAMPEP_0196579660 /NCGR_PEP_ID=MMETSP1081-20130531/24302_1 /TAXON_ID=36882 /ORGANISM="Pyramimonas amylifera, Strain CCMP720" /LENGTH=68 /DNA_ID=CAMNT_0041899309 /DNA_START=224 /DNA_END=430 /DNA_ORIENTATION=-